MKDLSKYQDVIETRIKGLPCKIGVLNYEYHKPTHSIWTAHCPEDAEGWVDLDYDILDRKGYKADWIEAKMTEYDFYSVEETIHEHYRNKDQEYAEAAAEAMYEARREYLG